MEDNIKIESIISELDENTKYKLEEAMVNSDSPFKSEVDESVIEQIAQKLMEKIENTLIEKIDEACIEISTIDNIEEMVQNKIDKIIPKEINDLKKSLGIE